MTKVKICGITNLEDALLAARLGADALGFNFCEKSPRYVCPETARTIIDQLPSNVLKVGVFVNESIERIAEIAKSSSLDAVQLHGDESPDVTQTVKHNTGLQVIKAFRVSTRFNVNDVRKYDVDAILLDAYSADNYGGTGETFDWDIARLLNCQQLYLAGGLTTENVAAAINTVRPFAVDVGSGIEIAKGKKDPAKLEAFIRNAKNA